MISIIRIYYGDWATVLAVVLFFAVAVLSALVLHEVAHGWAALKCGDPSAKFAGRLSLNPAKHLDLIGALCFVFVGFGWAKPVPINPNNFNSYRKGLFLVSIAGIVMNLIIGFVASLVYVLLLDYGIWANLPMYIMVVNVCFAVFNLLPVPPLDGFNILASMTKPTNRTIAFLRRNSLPMLLLLFIIIQFTGFLNILQFGIIKVFLDFWGLFI
jgi:Zn-dependent protease